MGGAGRGWVFVSRASLWELAIKISLGKVRLDLPLSSGRAERDGLFWLSIDTRHLLTVAELPTLNDHRDPFDRLLVAQSMTEPLILLTTDGKMSRCGSTVRVV